MSGGWLVVVTQLGGCIVVVLGLAGVGMVCRAGNVRALARIGLALPALRRPSGYGPLFERSQTLMLSGFQTARILLTKHQPLFRPWF